MIYFVVYVDVVENGMIMKLYLCLPYKQKERNTYTQFHEINKGFYQPPNTYKL